MTSILFGASIAKSLFPILGAQGTTVVRLVFGAAIMFVMLRAWRAEINSRNWQALTVYGVVLGAMNLMFYLAVNRLPLGIASALEFLGPLAVAVIYSRRPTDFAWVGLAAIGLLLLTPLAGPVHSLDPLGIVWALGAATCWAFYIVFGKKAGAQHGTYTAPLGTMIAAMVALPFGVAEAGTTLLDVKLLPIILAVAVLTSAIPFTLEMFALRRLPARAFGTLMSIEPAIGALIGLVYLHESLTIMQWLAIVLIVTASIGTTLSVRQPAPAT